jgi:hypothetical protein
MRDFSWLNRGKRIVFKIEPFELWRTGTIRTVLDGITIAIVVKDGNSQNSIHVKYENIVGEATERVTPFPFYWGNVLEHLTEEAKENL